MTTDFAAVCNEQITLANRRLAELDAQRGELSAALKASQSADAPKISHEIEKRLLVLEGEVAHLTIRRSAWAKALEHGYFTIPAMRVGFRGAIT